MSSYPVCESGRRAKLLHCERDMMMLRTVAIIGILASECIVGMPAAYGVAGEPSKQDFINAVLHDPEAPVAGNPDGDVTIVAFLDYNCPFCRRSTPELDRFIASDPKVRVVYKDWPILAASSLLEAQSPSGKKLSRVSRL